MATLQDLIIKKQDIEAMLVENEGELTQALETMWDDTSLEIKDKVDRYGHVLQQLESAKASVTQKKRERTEQYVALSKRIDNEINSIKGRLNYFAGDKRLEGNEVKFSPFVSRVADSINMELVEADKCMYQLPKMDYDTYSFIHKIFNDGYVQHQGVARLFGGVEKSTNATILGEGHPAITYKIRPSVRMYD